MLLGSWLVFLFFFFLGGGGGGVASLEPKYGGLRKERPLISTPKYRDALVLRTLPI